MPCRAVHLVAAAAGHGGQPTRVDVCDDSKGAGDLAVFDVAPDEERPEDVNQTQVKRCEPGIKSDFRAPISMQSAWH